MRQWDDMAITTANIGLCIIMGRRMSAKTKATKDFL
jgi:hypothetical protein